jgi:hypothetical protein
MMLSRRARRRVAPRPPEPPLPFARRGTALDHPSGRPMRAARPHAA